MKSYFVFLSRNKLYAAIQLFGLSVALAFVILLASYARTEFSVGRDQAGTDRIYMAGRGDSFTLPGTAPSGIFANIPEISSCARVYDSGTMDVFHGDKGFEATSMAVDTTFFHFFDYRVHGTDRRRALAAPDEIIISESFARKAFPGEDPIGKSLTTGGKQPLTVVGVVEDFDGDDLFRPVDILRSMLPLEQSFSRGRFNMDIFVRLTDGASVEQVEASMLDIFMQEYDFWAKTKETENTWTWGASLTALEDVYFSPRNEGHRLRHGDRTMVHILVVAALILLLSAVFNYINLTMALVGKRAKEIATRRLMGDSIGMVILRHFAEALVFVAGSFACACLLTAVICPWFEALTGSEIHFRVDAMAISLTVTLLLATAVVAGLLPAMIVSRFKPMDVVKGTFRFYNRKWLSRVFIVLQNTISACLIAVGLTMAAQTYYLDTLPMGYRPDNIVEISTLYLGKHKSEVQPFYNALMAIPQVKSVGFTGGIPHMCQTNGVHCNGDGTGAEELSWVSLSELDSTSMQMLGLEIVEQYRLPEEGQLYITEETRNRYGVTPERPYFGRRAEDGTYQYNVCGVIKDYRSYDAMETPMKDVHSAVTVCNGERYLVYILVELHELDTEARHAAVEKVRDVCNRMSVEMFGVEKDLEVRTMRDSLNIPLKKQHRFTNMMLCFMCMSILISALGMLGMSVSYTEQNSKQIALRRVMGATIGSTVWELARPFLLMSLLATLIAMPVATLAMQRYLEDFYNRIPFPWWILILSVTASLLISFLSVIWHASRVAHKNPVESIRTE